MNAPAERMPPALLADLPGELRYRLARQTRAPSDLHHAASAIQDTLDAIFMDASEDDLNAAAVRLRAQVDLASNILTSLATFAGELDGLGWVCGLTRPAEPTAGPKPHHTT